MAHAKRLVSLAILLLLPGCAPDVPPALVPDPVPVKALPGWGSAYDPDGDCQFQESGSHLTILVPGTLHELGSETRRVNAPRVLQPVQGDFVAVVRVQGTLEPDHRGTPPSHAPYQGTGLLVWQDSNNYLRLERGAIVTDRKPKWYINFRFFQRGQSVASSMKECPSVAVSLRIQRNGNQFKAAYSSDGSRWEGFPAVVAQFGPDVRAGVSAINTAVVPLKAELESLRLDGKGVGAVLDPDEQKITMPGAAKHD